MELTLIWIDHSSRNYTKYDSYEVYDQYSDRYYSGIFGTPYPELSTLAVL